MSNLPGDALTARDAGSGHRAHKYPQPLRGAPSAADQAGPQAADRQKLYDAFESILYQQAREPSQLPRTAPAYFRDLNLDQIVEVITAHKDEYDLKPFFYDALTTTDAIAYRHEVMGDLEHDRTLDRLNAFARKMSDMREQIARAQKLYYRLQKERWFLHAAETWCAAIRDLQADLAAAPLSSRGLLAFRAYVNRYAECARFVRLAATVGKLVEDLGAIHYCVLIKDNSFKVRKYDGEVDYSADILDTFRKFRQDDAEARRTDVPEAKDMNHIEAKILEFVARLYPEVFSRLEAFCLENRDFTDTTLARFDREVQFYISYMDYLTPLKRAGLCFCYPLIAVTDKTVSGEDAFDLALATKLIQEQTPVVCNDLQLTGNERILVISGPNQGGKTTFARMFGQLHHLASIGCPVPGRHARLFLFDALFTHFEREEDIRNRHGKLQDDLVRIHEILTRATPRSVVIMNEIFTSTALRDAVFLAREVLGHMIDLDCLGVCVTFLEELSSLNEKTVSMVSTVVPDNPAVRTYKVVRRPADGRSYALSIAEKYRVTYDCLKARIPE
ncbi:MutS-related protein [Rhodopila globiformis]|uniref:DNA mismatch repair protein MutS n=1 Tax=Rhodopila globiformis TaxID=1071 RepID=A0A2S6NGB7_RHOGL|nr:DNA mismatch repair protein MutS [Rhodopila globiformis]PPQ33609.1 DNA mismatch repair protein MutS [Rhodopila globiformis]